MITRQKTPKEIVAEHKAAEAWLKFIMPRDFPGYYDDAHNSDIMLEHIDSVLDGWITIENLSAAAEACRLRLHGLGVASLEAKAAAERAEAEKIEAERLQKLSEHNVRVATAYIKDHAPTGLIIGNDFYGSTSDKIVAFLQRNYPSRPLTDAMLNEAIETLWDALDWWDRSESARQFRNVPPPPARRLSEQAQIDAGMKPARLKGHEADAKPVSMADAAKKAREIFNKAHGITDDANWKRQAEQMSVSNIFGRLDHAKTASLRGIYATNNTAGEIDWKTTYEWRFKAASEIEKDIMRGRR